MNLMRRLLPLLSLFALLPARGAEPLEPEQAYRYSARALDAQTLEARWQIADGYYMYREKIRFTVEPATVKLGEPELPPGEAKDDEFFGRVETYRNEVRVRIPVDTGGAATVPLIGGVSASETWEIGRASCRERV
mgnify:CR=1 FL=1